MFSIIIPVYNRAHLLDLCLLSLVNQSFKNFEVIVSDDGSEDNINEIIKKYENSLRITYLFGPNWGGPAKPRNNGIEKSSYDWICFLDSDDRWYPSKLEEVIPFTQTYDLIYHDLDVYYNGKYMFYKSLKNNSSKLKSPIFNQLLTNGNIIPNSSVCVRKDIVFKAGLFSEDKKMISVEDFDLWLRISLLTEKFFYIRKKLGIYSIGDSNISRKSIKNSIFTTYNVIKINTKGFEKGQRKKLLAFYFFYLSLLFEELNKFETSLTLKRIFYSKLSLFQKIKGFIFLFLFIPRYIRYKIINQRKGISGEYIELF